MNQKYLEQGQRSTSAKHVGGDQLALAVEFEVAQAAELQQRKSVGALSLLCAPQGLVFGRVNLLFQPLVQYGDARMSQVSAL
jgi:hypothetical protein